MKLGFDIDDTLINLREHAFHLYNRKLGTQVDIARMRELNCIPIHEAFGLNAEEGRQMWGELREQIYFSDCPPYPGAVEALNELDRLGHEIYYITARAQGYCDKTLEWLTAAGFPVRPGRFYCGMGDAEKIHVIRELALDYYFDDKPVVLDTLAGLRMQVYVRDQPYNRHVTLPRVVSWDELYKLLSIVPPK
ncbi:HAD family acid phosphatase [Cohnella sp. GbtcB17]|uniref:5' nucleotidase, NT5C type n=1 Tax=Cohnella sp. GbtcB17 TaxID=2824762 RepID=UPI001C2F50DF|nr:HAD family acid phosphatase [Cohnella sp. GbtcB17]